MQQQGKVQLSDKVSRYLTGHPAWADSIEVGQLLNYTSGLPDVPGDTDDGMQDSLLKLDKLAFRPGTAYIYSYANVFLQRKIIEKGTKLSYAAFVDRLLFQPCHIRDVAAQNSSGATLIAEPFTNTFKPVSMNAPASAGNFLTARDLYRWDTRLAGGELLNGSSP